MTEPCSEVQAGQQRGSDAGSSVEGRWDSPCGAAPSPGTRRPVTCGGRTSHLPLRRYHLKDVIVGKIYFLLVRIKIKHMEIDIIKRETTGTGPNVYHENDTIAKYEIMDGAPVRGELRPHGLGPAPVLEGLQGSSCQS